MSKYDRVRGLLDVVGAHQGGFDFSSVEHCMIGIGIAENYISEGDAYGGSEWLERVAGSLNLTERQAKEVYCGHAELYAQYVDAKDQSSVMAHRDRMMDKAFCINYVHSLIETWEAVDRAASGDRQSLLERIDAYESCNA